MPPLLRTLPVYYPTTTLVVDDDPLFLRGVARALLPDKPVRLFSDPIKLIEYINQPNPAKLFTSYWVNEAPKRDEVNVSLATIEKQLYIDARFSEVTCIVADFSMPQMDGLKMINTINRSEICRVLFTGTVTVDGAIAAFNDQLISKFITKSLGFPLKELRAFLDKSQKEHAIRRFSPFSGVFDKRIFRVFTDSGFSQWFDRYLLDNKIIEYYRVSKIHGFYVADFYGNAKILLVHDKEFISNQIDAIKANSGPVELTSLLVSYEALSVFDTGNGLYGSVVEDWRSNVFVVSKVIGTDDPLFIAEVQDARTVGINCSSMTFSQYIDYLQYVNQRC